MQHMIPIYTPERDVEEDKFPTMLSGAITL